ncbi:cytochrome c oxidase assembly protein [Staphylospora marina]|uniref:cytochrome c oxidase assembly protein n=1 Tax=Staphylospora marina TaxID=2490858 RepID=UPI000F5B9DDB|nr:cytochrome c oxidase assembly protein [Staphylospora marina]
MTSADFFKLFTHATNWDVGLNLVYMAVAVLYLLVVGPFRERLGGTEPVSGFRKSLFLSGLIIWYFSEGSALDLLAHELFSMHMMQMSLNYFVVPPLIILGIPRFLWRFALGNAAVKSVFSFFTRPVISLFFFNGMIWFYHVPVVFDALMANHLYHNIAHSMLMVAAFCTWWPIIAPLPEMNQLKTLLRVALIFANGFLITPACAIITFTDTVLFESYSQMSTVAPVLSPLHDQQFGGVIMKIMQEAVYIVAIMAILAQWFKESKARDEEELEMIRSERSHNGNTLSTVTGEGSQA